jgi:hypothetical protein
MTIPRPLLPILAATFLGGIVHAGEFSFGGADLLADNSAAPAVDVSVNFTDRGRAMHETAEGGDSAPRDSRTLRGADTVEASDTTAPAPHAHASPKSAPHESGTADAPHGVSISPPTAIRRPSYRWQSLVPGTIK